MWTVTVDNIFRSCIIFLFIVFCLHKHLGIEWFLGIFTRFKNTVVIYISGNGCTGNGWKFESLNRSLKFIIQLHVWTFRYPRFVPFIHISVLAQSTRNCNSPDLRIKFNNQRTVKLVYCTNDVFLKTVSNFEICVVYVWWTRFGKDNVFTKRTCQSTRTLVCSITLTPAPGSIDLDLTAMPRLA